MSDNFFVNVVDDALAIPESLAAFLGNYFFDVGAGGAEIVTQPSAYGRGLGDPEAAELFQADVANRRKRLPRLNVSPKTAATQEKYLRPVAEYAGEKISQFEKRFPNEAELISTLVGDPRLAQAMIGVETAAPFALHPRTKLPGMGEMFENAAVPVSNRQRGMANLFDDSKRNPVLDPESRLQRAKDLGYTLNMFHGSTWPDITEFDGYRTALENDWGKGVYTSNTIDDVNANYAGIGPDTRFRITDRTEQLENEFFSDPEYLREVIERDFPFLLGNLNRAQNGSGMFDLGEVADATARLAAKKEVVGGAPQGVVYPLAINPKNFAVIDRYNPTYIEGPNLWEEATKQIDNDPDTLSLDYDDYMDKINDRFYELQDTSDETPSAKIVGAIHEVVDDPREANVLVEQIQDVLLDTDRVSVYDLDQAIRGAGEYWVGGESLYGGPLSSTILRELGFDGLIDRTVNDKFGTRGNRMAGVKPETEHAIIFPGKENRIRSIFADFDPSKTDSKNILAGTAAAMFGGGLLMEDGENQ